MVARQRQLCKECFNQKLRNVGVINEDELIYLVRVFIIATEITVEDERLKTDGWFGEITTVVNSRK